MNTSVEMTRAAANFDVDSNQWWRENKMLVAAIRAARQRAARAK